MLSKALEGIADIEVVAQAPNGVMALSKLEQLKTDLALLDAGTDDMSAAELTREILKRHEHMGVIMTAESGAESEQTIQALESGAFDFIEKPQADFEQASEILQRKLLPKIRTFSIRRYSRAAKIDSGAANRNATGIAADSPAGRRDRVPGAFKILAMGVSTGGPDALARIIPALPREFPLPIVIVIHMPKSFTASLSENLNKKSLIRVREAVDGDVLESGVAYVAPGGVHLVVKKAPGNRYMLACDDGPTENGCKPSVDVLFRSLAESCSQKEVVATLLTGMGSDGAAGMGLLKKNGAAWNIVQDEQTSLVWGMPGSAVRAGVADEVLPLDDIAGRLLELVGMRAGTLSGDEHDRTF